MVRDNRSAIALRPALARFHFLRQLAKLLGSVCNSPLLVTVRAVEISRWAKARSRFQVFSGPRGSDTLGKRGQERILYFVLHESAGFVQCSDNKNVIVPRSKRVDWDQTGQRPR